MQRAVSGSNSNYLDRSVMAIGEHPSRVSPLKKDFPPIYAGPVDDLDTGFVRSKLENIKNYGMQRHNQTQLY